MNQAAFRNRKETPGRAGTIGWLAVACAAAATLALNAHGADTAKFVAPSGHAGAVLREYCWDCHGDGSSKGGVAFDRYTSDTAMLEDREVWLKALKNVRAGIMPPKKKPQPGPEEKRQLEEWIKTAVFKADPNDPDPGRVTLRRLNRVEYRNTIRDLLGIEFDTEKEFPPDDAGHGFDNIGDALTLPPMLLEKYLAAAKAVVTRAVPTTPRVPAEKPIVGRRFKGAPEYTPNRTNRNANANSNPNFRDALVLSYYDPAAATNRYEAEHAGRYQLLLDLAANERFVDNQFDYNKCRLVFKADGRELHRKEYGREGGKSFHYEFDVDWSAGAHELTVEVEPLTPDQKQVRSLTLRLDSVTVRGPMEEKFWVRPKNYERFFTQDAPAPADAAARRQYAREILGPFALFAFRRPVDAGTVERLAAVAESSYNEKGKSFEAGIAQAMVAALASPRFLFREESAAPVRGKGHPWVDEFTLASRLSYFLWSSMPDGELFRLAEAGTLRAGLDTQVERMLADRKSDALVRNFVGQWLQVRDIETVQIDSRQVLFREAAPNPDQERRRARSRELRDKEEDGTITPEERKELTEMRNSFPRGRRFNQQQLRAEMTGDVRRAMRQETERTFDYILRQNRSLLELLDSDYTFLNERLARHYGLTNLNVTGDEMVLTKLPAEDPRGGVLTHGSVLGVTSNPTRTSPVKRGLFVLDNLLGTPPPPPPPDIPPLEDAAKAMREKKLTLRETLALHREQALCGSCHDRMDPLGLALDNFNAMGIWRDKEQGQTIDAAGALVSGERFTGVKELKQILVTNHARQFYRTITEKLLTYALGRGLDYYDVAPVDAIVERLEKSNGRPSELLSGIIASAPFQKTRAARPAEPPNPPSGQRADARTNP